MNDAVTWLEAHDELAGWAQFIGAVLALAVTYCTAFAPGWRRKRQLHGAARRLLANGYEVIESYHRTSAHFAPFPRSLQQASLTMTAVVDEMARFPIFELEDQIGPLSIARRLVTMGLLVSTVRLDLDSAAADLGERTATDEEHEALRILLGERLAVAQALVTGAELKRPVWSS